VNAFCNLFTKFIKVHALICSKSDPYKILMQNLYYIRVEMGQELKVPEIFKVDSRKVSYYLGL
jgi:hypothetical protein